MHEMYMKLAVEMALKGLKKTFTNPLVGAVIVKDERIIAKGAHLKFGENHAEVNAILSCQSPKELINSTLYVTLEPCCHKGKQPPCTDLIIQSGIKKIIIGQLDPNPIVSGKGIKKLRDSGIEVVIGILEKEVRKINAHYNTFFEKRRPFVTLKQSISLDGKLGLFQKRTAITGQQTNNFIKKERANYQAILVGSETVLVDNPTLNTNEKTFSIIRVVLDRRGRLFEKTNLNLFVDSSNPVIVFTESEPKKELPTHVEVIRKKQITIETVLDELTKRQVQSIYVEGGAKIHDAFLTSDLWDELITYMSPMLIGGNGVASFSSSRQIIEAIDLINVHVEEINQDIRIAARRLL